MATPDNDNAVQVTKASLTTADDPLDSTEEVTEGEKENSESTTNNDAKITESSPIRKRPVAEITAAADDADAPESPETEKNEDTEAPENDELPPSKAPENDSPPAKDPPASPLLPPKKARTAYFIFMEQNRAAVQQDHVGAGVAVVAKALGQRWGALTAEEKTVYQEQAAKEKQVYVAARAAYEASTVHSTTNTTAPLEQSPDHLIMPVARIRKIAKLDPDVHNISKEALLLTCKAAELFTAKLGLASCQQAVLQNRRKLRPSDVAQTCASREAWQFLRDDLADLLKHQEEEKKQQELLGKSLKKAPDVPVAAGKTITSYFATKK